MQDPLQSKFSLLVNSSAEVQHSCSSIGRRRLALANLVEFLDAAAGRHHCVLQRRVKVESF